MTESGLAVDELAAYGRISNAVDNVGVGGIFMRILLLLYCFCVPFC